MKPNFVLEFREAPHGLLRIQKCSAGVDQPCVRYPVREENREITDGIIRLDNQHHEPVCEMGALKIYVHAYVDRVEIRFVTESPDADQSAAMNKQRQSGSRTSASYHFP